MANQPKTTGIVRRIDPLGRIVIPKEIRRTQRLPDGTPMEICPTEEGILLRRYAPVDESDIEILVHKTEQLMEQLPEGDKLQGELLDYIRVLCRVRKKLG